MKYFIFGMLFMSQTILAQEPALDPACRNARQNYCHDKSTVAEIRLCLLNNKSTVDEGCREVIKGNLQKFQKVIKVCKEQIWKICDKNFKGNVQACFRVERDQFTGECGTMVRALK